MARFRRFLPCSAALLLMLATAWLYAPADAGDFVMFDDDINLYSNPHLGGPSAERMRWMFADTDYMRRYLPLGWLGFSLIFAGSGLDPAGYHAASVALHALNAGIVFALGLALLKLISGERRARDLFLAALAAAGWALHPLRVEPVAWASGLLYVHATFWALLAAWAYLQTFSAAGARRALWLAASVGAFACSLLTYPLALGFPVALLALDYWHGRREIQLGRDPHWRRLVGEKIWFGALAAVFLGLAIFARVHTAGASAPVLAVGEFDLAQRFAQAARVWAYFVWRPFAPLGLSPVYETLQTVRPLAWPFLASALAVLAISAWFIRCRRSWPGAACLWLAYLGLLLPYLGWLETPFYPCDRYAYLPGALVTGAAALAVSQLVSWRVVTLAWVALTVFGAWLVRPQLTIWADTPRLYRHIISGLTLEPLRVFYEGRLAIHHAQMGRFAEARAQLAGDPAGDEARAQRARDRALLDAIERGAREAPVVLRSGRDWIAPAAAQSHRLALGLAKTGDAVAAEAHWRRALRLDPEFADARYNYAMLLALTGRPRAALAQWLWLERHLAAPLPAVPGNALAACVSASFSAAGEGALAAACAKRAGENFPR